MPGIIKLIFFIIYNFKKMNTFEMSVKCFLCLTVIGIILFLALSKYRQCQEAQFLSNIEAITKSNKIVIVGITGSGKSTICSKLVKYGYDYINLDDMYWTDMENYSKNIKEKLRKYKNQDSRVVIDGQFNYGSFHIKDYWHKLDLIIYLDTNPIIRFISVIIRDVVKKRRYNILVDFFDFKQGSLLWNSLGFDYQQKNLDRTLLDFKLERKIRYGKAVQRYNESVRQGQTPKTIRNKEEVPVIRIC